MINTIISVNEVMNISEEILSNLYSSGDDFKKFNVFFILLNEYYYLETEKIFNELAYICYLLSYYVFICITPPMSENIALMYANKAIEYHDTLKYRKWLEEVKRGN